MRWLRMVALVALCILPVVSQALPVDAIELANFQCPHCRHLNRYISSLQREFAKQGGVWRLAPVEPAQDNLPDVSVRVWYAIDDISGDKVADTAAKYLYLGYQKGATLNSVGGVYAWLADYMTGLPSLHKLREATYSPVILRQWKLALSYFSKLPSRNVPAVIFLSPDTYGIVGIIQRGPKYKNAAAIYAASMQMAKRMHAIHPQPLRLPWQSSALR